MPRIPIQGVFTDGTGNIVVSGNATFYNYYSTAPSSPITIATIYENQTGGSAVASGVITTDSNGGYLAWIDSDDYVASSIFTLILSKSTHSDAAWHFVIPGLSFKDATETLTNKTLTSPILTTPQLNDTSKDHQYITAVNELSADRTVTMPLLLGNDTFVFADFIQILTNKTLTAPKIGTSVLDTNGLQLMILTATASAVNEITLANAATGNDPTLTASGDDTNIGINLVPKGTGTIQTDGAEIVNAVNVFTYRSGLQCSRASATTVEITAGELMVDSTPVRKQTTTTIALTTAGDWVDNASHQATATNFYIYINNAGTIEFDDQAPDASDTDDNTSGILRYNNTGVDTSWRRCIGNLLTNSTGSGELDADGVWSFDEVVGTGPPGVHDHSDAANLGNTLLSVKLTTPQINDTSADHQYVFAVSELSADRTVTMPLLIAGDTFVFENFIQTLTGKNIGDPTDNTKDIAFTLSGATTAKTLTLISAHTDDRSITFPDVTDTLVGKTTTDTLTNKTLTTPTIGDMTNAGHDHADAAGGGNTLLVPTIASFANATHAHDVASGGGALTLPQINDTSSDHQYIFAVSELIANRIITLPLLTGNDEFVFKDFIQTLTNKTLTTPTIADFTNASHTHADASNGGAVTLLSGSVLTLPQINDTSSDHQYVFAVNELSADRTVTMPLLTTADEFVFKDHAVTLTNKTLTTPIIASFASATHDHADAAGGGNTLTAPTMTTPSSDDITLTGSAASTPDANTITKDHLIGARCTFNGTGTPAYIEEINFSGAITDNGTGEYTLTIDRDFANANYAYLGSTIQVGGVSHIVSFSDIAVGSLKVWVDSDGGSPTDVASASVVLIGPQ